MANWSRLLYVFLIWTLCKAAFLRLRRSLLKMAHRPVGQPPLGTVFRESTFLTRHPKWFSCSGKFEGHYIHKSEVKWKSLSRVRLLAIAWTIQSVDHSPAQNTGLGSFSLLQGFLVKKNIHRVLCAILDIEIKESISQITSRISESKLWHQRKWTQLCVPIAFTQNLRTEFLRSLLLATLNGNKFSYQLK